MNIRDETDKGMYRDFISLIPGDVFEFKSGIGVFFMKTDDGYVVELKHGTLCRLEGSRNVEQIILRSDAELVFKDRR